MKKYEEHLIHVRAAMAEILESERAQILRSSAIQTNEDKPNKPKQKFQFQYLFGFLACCAGAVPFIIWDAVSGIWNLLAVFLCLVLMVLGSLQITITSIRETEQKDFLFWK